jgi:single-stranded DNA-binding protein
MNEVTLRGTLAQPVELNHTSHEAKFYRLWLDVKRLSGKEDCLRILAPEEALQGFELSEGDGLAVRGQMRTYNNKSGVGGRLIVSALAREVRHCKGEDINNAYLSGTLCRMPSYRKTPLGREICDIMLAVPRLYGRADYLPLIAWGGTARAVSAMEAGQPLFAAGRFQSRGYTKVTDAGPVEMTAYEVSVVRLFGSEEELLEASGAEGP